MSKILQLTILDKACELCADKNNGSIRTTGLNIDRYLQLQVRHCEEAGATREEINAILNKYFEK